MSAPIDDAHNDMTVFVVSDGTGDTGSAAVRAAMIQFRHRWRLRVFRDTRSISDVRRVVEQAEQANALRLESQFRQKHFHS